MTLRLLDDNPSLSLVDRMVAGIQRAIDTGHLRPGMRLPSIRRFAAEQGVSRFTVVEAYDRLVAQGVLVSKRGAGFYVAPEAAEPPAEERGCPLDRAVDTVWLIRGHLASECLEIKPGSGYLPEDWLDQEGFRRSLRTLARDTGPAWTQAADPKGYPPLVEQVRRMLADCGIGAHPKQILLTRGGTGALQLIARYLIAPGDAILVEDPGYYLLFSDLRLSGAELVGVPRRADGPDLEVLESLARQYRPRLFFLQSLLHNPTGTSLSAASAYRLLQLAERHNFHLVENDAYAALAPETATRLAALDQLQRVIYLGSFSKVLSPSLPVGYIACHPDLAEALTDLKMLSGLAAPDLAERLVHTWLAQGRHRKHLERLRERLRKALGETAARLADAGLTLFHVPEDGWFLWARLPEALDSARLAREALAEGLMFAPGNVFSPHPEPSPWLRFNAARSNDPRIYRFLAQALEREMRPVREPA
ncbi:PLP-dependent aminotransferase family protein [Candidatus Methylocalor cossyra]|uniref:Transcriptional regulator, GntR family / Aspartate aminotransferase n=1 Tax=Candidatus Methylocalor cossyra TaxID=3108543 RepID=A0ABP1C9G5_9GAMM